MALDARHQHIAHVLAHQFRMPVASVEAVLAEKDTWLILESFFAANGEPTRVMFFRQPREVVGEEGEYEQRDEADAELFLTTGDAERQKGRAVYFIRSQLHHAVEVATLHNDLSFGVVGPNSLEHLQVRRVASHASRQWPQPIRWRPWRGAARRLAPGLLARLVVRFPPSPRTGDSLRAVRASDPALGAGLGRGGDVGRRDAGVLLDSQQVFRHCGRGGQHAQLGLHAQEARQGASRCGGAGAGEAGMRAS